METYSRPENDPSFLRLHGYATRPLSPDLEAKLQKIGAENRAAASVRAELKMLAGETCYTFSYLEDLFRRYSGYQTLGRPQ